METFVDPRVAPGQRQIWYPWPYVEGITIAEAANELAFLVTGIYGKSLPKQYGAPIRLALPWKNASKSIKSIKRITFTEERPKSFWEQLQAAEYGFWANVNPEVAHPRWSQATEEVLGENRRIPTQLFNGYGSMSPISTRGWRRNASGRDQYTQRCALLTMKSRKTCTRATPLSDSGKTR